MPAPADASTLPRPRLLLLDGHSLAYRAFYALPVENFSTTTGQPTNAVYGFTSMLINVLRDEVPSHLAVAFDVSRNTFRAAEYVDYKANRQVPGQPGRAPKAYLNQMALYREAMRAAFPGRTVRCALLWTDGPRLMPLPDGLLDIFAP